MLAADGYPDEAQGVALHKSLTLLGPDTRFLPLYSYDEYL